MALDTAAAVTKLRGLTSKFDTGVESAEPFYPRICTEADSTGADEEYGLMGSMPGVREWLGERQFNSLRAGKFTIKNRLWENSVEIEQTRIEDDKLGFYAPALEEMGIEAAYHPDELVFDLIVKGESQECFDGQNFFDTDHKWGDSGTQSNDLTYNVADAGNVPTEAEARAAFHAARTAMLKFKRDNGKTFVRPTIKPLPNLLLLCPPDLEEVFTKALTSTLTGGGDSNIVLDAPTIVASASLTDASKWYLLDMDGALKPFVFQRRRPLRRQMKGLDDNEFKDVKFMTDARYNAGYLAWWKATVTDFN